MRRGVQVAGGGGGFNKPPPVPLPHSGARGRLHSHDGTGSLSKDRFGSPRDRSPSLGSTLPISPSHPINREKSSNAISQDLHDCSMCLSAYIQSLNTVCGTACRLSQCLAQVGSDHDVDIAGSQFTQLLKEAAEIWEGIARIVGVASTGVKNQIILLIQELQGKCHMDLTDQALKQEVAKMVKMMLSTFLNLHCQFSLIIVEKFSGTLQHLREENVGPNGYFADIRPNVSPNVSPHRPSPSPPNLGMQSQYNMMSSQHLLQYQQQQQLLLQQQQHQIALQQQLLQMAQQQQQLAHSNSKTSTISENLPSKDDSSLGYSSNGNYSGTWSTGLGSPLNTQQPSLNSSPNVNTSANTLSPGLCSNFSSLSNCGFGDWNNDAICRRWSMGGPSEEGWQEKRNSLTPFSLMVNRRWSVPETNEHDINAGVNLGGLQTLYGSCSSNEALSPYGSRTSPIWGGTKNSLHPISRESSSTRSPSHSRSVTPESKRMNSITNEELESVINLLSFSFGPSSRKSSGCSSISHESLSPKLNNFSPLEKIPLKHQRIPEVNQEFIENINFGTFASSTPRNELNQVMKSNKEALKSDKNQPPVMKVENNGKNANNSKNQISTPLWPPTDSVPGVTLTECIGEEEKENPNFWMYTSDCSSTTTDCGSRESINRSSWPSTAFARLGVLDDMGLMTSGQSIPGSDKGWSQLPVSAFRRHSSDAPYFPQNASLMGFKTRSFENITKVSDEENSKTNCLNSNIEHLLCLSSLTSPEVSPENSQYTLFTSTT